MITVAAKELSPSVALIVIGKGRGGTGCPGLSLKRNCALTPGTGRAKSGPLFTTGGSISNTFGVTFRMTGGSGPIIALRVTVPVARSPLRIASGAMEKDASWPGAGAAPSLSLCSHVSPRIARCGPSVSDASRHCRSTPRSWATGAGRCSLRRRTARRRCVFVRSR